MGGCEQPDFDFDLKFLGGDVAALPGVEKMIDVRSPLMLGISWLADVISPRLDLRCVSRDSRL